MKSALFVDFDNVFTQLRQVSPAAAERFARQPIEWIRWLTMALAIPDGHDRPDARRRLLVRRCYLNPNWYQTYRHAFLRAGFEIVDCPPVTSQGKTSTDIHMVLDMVELLAHETRYDEFIVLSADADFTPVLRKLRRYDRRTTVLAIGFPSAAYQASADLMIDERLFIEQALGLVGDEPELRAEARADGRAAAPVAALPAPQSATEPVAGGMLSVAPAWPATAAGPGSAADAAASAAAPGPQPRLATADELAQISHRISQTVAAAAQPVAAAFLALRLRQEFGAPLEQWNGQGSFKAFFRTLGLDHLVWLTGSGGRIADPQRHAFEPASTPAELAEADAHWAGSEALFPLAREVSGLTGAPLLPPAGVRAVLDLLCADLAQAAYEPTDTARRIVGLCPARCGIEVSMRDVVFILRGLQLNGHVFGRGDDDVRTLAQRLVNQMLFLCQREQMLLSEDSTAQLRQWIAGDLLD